jgi:hypothetical protein
MSATKYFLGVAMLFTFLMVSTFNASAQGGDDQFDFSTWWAFNVDFKIHKQFEIGLKEELRLLENSTRIDQVYTEVSLKYSPIKILDIGSTVRFAQEKKKNDYDFNVRWDFDVSIKQPINRFDIRYRIRYTNGNELGISVAEGDPLVHKLRFRTGLSYNIPKWKVDPQLDVEFFSNLNKDANYFEDKIRIRLSSEYEFKKAGELGFFIGYEHMFHNENQRNVSIVGLNYSMDVKKKKKKEKSEE